MEAISCVFQERHDDCLRACLATWLEIPYREMPEIYPSQFTDPEDFFVAWEQWLSSRGLAPTYFEYPAPTYLSDLDEDADLWIAFVEHSESLLHAVVMTGNRILHNPSPIQDERPPRFVYGMHLFPSLDSLLDAA